MAYRNSIRWDVPLNKFQDFDHGKEIECVVPTSWKLRHGDVLEYEAAQFYGRTQVVSCVEEEGLTMCDFSSCESGDDLCDVPRVPGARCVFKKLS